MAFANQSWMGFAVTPLFALGGLAQPALQSLLSGRVGPDKQGQLAGVLTSLSSLASIGGPVLATVLYFDTKSIWLGTVWVVAAALYVLATPLFAMVKPQRLSPAI
jgi:DHA1 family tetracycline resistance protein-like MFS transporter